MSEAVVCALAIAAIVILVAAEALGIAVVVELRRKNHDGKKGGREK